MGFIQMEEAHFAAFVQALLHSKIVDEIESALPQVVKDSTLAAGVLDAIPFPAAQAMGKVIGEIGAGASQIQAKVTEAQADLGATPTRTVP